MTTILVSGSRKWTDQARIHAELAALEQKCAGPWRLIHGGAKGADTMAAEWATGRPGWTVQCYPYIRALGMYGGKARNQQMLDENVVHVGIVFRKDKSGGSSDMLKKLHHYAESHPIRIIQIDY